MRILRFLPALLLALLLGSGSASAAGADGGLDLGSLADDKSEVAKDEMNDVGMGDLKTFTIKTDDDIAALEVNDIYRNDLKTFFKVVGIDNKSSTGGAFTLQRTNGKAAAGVKFHRVSGAGPQTIAARETLLDLYLQGGVFLHPIALLLVVTIILALNCMMVYRPSRQIPPDFVTKAEKLLKKGDIAKFEQLALAERGLFAHLCRAMSERYSTSTPREIKERVEIVAGAQINRMRGPVKALNLISVAAPLLGLLGTIVGMVIVFDAVASATGAAKAQALAQGIRVKLFSTAAALMVALPALFLYFGFNQRLGSLIASCELTAERFLHRIVQLKRAGGVTTHLDEEEEEEEIAEDDDQAGDGDEPEEEEEEEIAEEPVAPPAVRPRRPGIARGPA